MTEQQRREARIYLEAVASAAKALAMELERGSLWEGDFADRLCFISSQMTKARELAKHDR